MRLEIYAIAMHMSEIELEPQLASAVQFELLSSHMYRYISTA